MATKNLSLQNFYQDSLKDILNADDTVIYLNSIPSVTEGFLVISPDDPVKKEIIYYNATNSGAGTVTCPSVALGRGIGGTTAQSHVSGEPVKMNITAEYWKALQDGTAINHIDAVNIETFRREVQCDGVVSGLILNPLSGFTTLTTEITGGIAYIKGVRVVTPTFNHTFTASKDTYVDLSKDGVFTYIEVANAGSKTNEPALTANSVRIMKVFCDGTKIAGFYDRRPWQWIYLQPTRIGDEIGTFHNSWVNYDNNYWSQARFMKTPDGFVQFEGLIRSGVINQAICIMPPGYRVLRAILFACDASGAFGRIQIQHASGSGTDNCVLQNIGGNGYLELTIRYKADA